MSNIKIKFSIFRIRLHSFFWKIKLCRKLFYRNKKPNYKEKTIEEQPEPLFITFFRDSIPWACTRVMLWCTNNKEYHIGVDNTLCTIEQYRILRKNNYLIGTKKNNIRTRVVVLLTSIVVLLAIFIAYNMSTQISDSGISVARVLRAIHNNFVVSVFLFVSIPLLIVWYYKNLDARNMFDIQQRHNNLLFFQQLQREALGAQRAGTDGSAPTSTQEEGTHALHLQIHVLFHLMDCVKGKYGEEYIISAFETLSSVFKNVFLERARSFGSAVTKDNRLEFVAHINYHPFAKYVKEIIEKNFLVIIKNRNLYSKLYLMGVDLKNMQLQGLNLRNIVFTGADLRWTQCQDVDLRGAQLNGVDMSEACFNGSNISSAEIINANLRSSKLNGANITNTVFNGSVLYRAQINGAVAKQAKMNCSNLCSAFMNGIDLTDAQLNGADLIEAQVNCANLSNASLIGANLFETELKGATLEKSDIRGYIFERHIYTVVEITSYLKKMIGRGTNYDQLTDSHVGKVMTRNDVDTIVAQLNAEQLPYEITRTIKAILDDRIDFKLDLTRIAKTPLTQQDVNTAINTL